MADKLKIGIILSTTREGRLGEGIGRWALELARKRSDATFELVDLRDHPLPFFEAKMSPARSPIDTPTAKRWSETIDAFDGYVFVTAEYNHSITGVLKNALDYLYPEVRRKPATFIGYGAVGGVRAVEHLRNILAELQVATLRFAVHIGKSEILGLVREGKTLADYPDTVAALTPALDELLWWAETLKAGRERAA
ncbi:NADPH-dependent FMN reductase [Corallococcus sp. RDP092CA]|uniref:NADPH-dependent FMN reductase n=1 Tax=Corallococcus sp. RDP092CA TaxID=3109369 RepID=UPI0035B3DD44